MINAKTCKGNERLEPRPIVEFIVHNAKIQLNVMR